MARFGGVTLGMVRMQNTLENPPQEIQRLAEAAGALATSITQYLSAKVTEAANTLEQNESRKAMEPVLTVPQAAEHLQVSRRTIDKLMKQGILPYLKIGRTVRIRAREVDAVLAQRCEVNRRLAR